MMDKRCVTIDEELNQIHEIPTRWEYTAKQMKKLWYTREDIKQSRQEHQEEQMMEQVKVVVEKRLEEEGTPERIDEIMQWPPTMILKYLETPVNVKKAPDVKPVVPITISDEDIADLFSLDISKSLANKGKEKVPASQPTKKLPKKKPKPTVESSSSSDSSSSDSSSSSGSSSSGSSSSSSDSDSSDSSDESDTSSDSDSDSSSSSSSSSSSEEENGEDTTSKSLWSEGVVKKFAELDTEDVQIPIVPRRFSGAPGSPRPGRSGKIFSPGLQRKGKKNAPVATLPLAPLSEPDVPGEGKKTKKKASKGAAASGKKGDKKGDTKKGASTKTKKKPKKSDTTSSEKSKDSNTDSSSDNTPSPPPEAVSPSGYTSGSELSAEDNLRKVADLVAPVSPLSNKLKDAVHNVQTAMAVDTYKQSLGDKDVIQNALDKYIPSDDDLALDGEDRPSKADECPICLGLVKKDQAKQIVLVTELLCTKCLKENEEIIGQAQIIVSPKAEEAPKKKKKTVRKSALPPSKKKEKEAASSKEGADDEAIPKSSSRGKSKSSKTKSTSKSKSSKEKSSKSKEAGKLGTFEELVSKQEHLVDHPPGQKGTEEKADDATGETNDE